jgi:hypothetical protein
MNKVVARFVDGRVLKGFTNDFTPAKDQFHLTPEGATMGVAPLAIKREELKALFFVKDFGGNPKHEEKKDFDLSKRPAGRKIKVVFKDGEMLIGTTLGYQRNRPGFFLESIDDESNIERCYVVTSATREISFV